jgi:hypothetical protein
MIFFFNFIVLHGINCPSISSGFFFLLNFVFLLGIFFEFFFIPISYHGCGFIKLDQVDTSFLL